MNAGGTVPAAGGPTAVNVAGLVVRSAGRRLLDDVSFSIEPGLRLGLIGESGSGKSLTALAILGLLPSGVTAAGSVTLGGAEVIGTSERDLVPLRGTRVAAVFQEPLTALDPLMRLGDQLAEPLRRSAARDGRRLSLRELRGAIEDSLAEVALAGIDRIVRAYPHEVSGGQRQRVAIAIALASRPQLLIADEPTTALDVTVQAEILELLDRVIDERGMALLFISHDLAVVARIADTVVVLRDGRMIEQGSLAALIAQPRHPYTIELVRTARMIDSALDHPGSMS